MGRMAVLLVLLATLITVTVAARSCQEKCDVVCDKTQYCSCTLQDDGVTSLSCSSATTTTTTADKYGCNKKCLACDATEYCECTSKGVTCTPKCPSTCDIGAGKTQTCDEIIKDTDHTCDTLTKRINCNCNGCKLCCPSTCDIGAGKKTCDEIIKDTDYTCDTLTKRINCNCNGCKLCRESNKVEASATTSKKSTKSPDSIAESDPVVVADGFIDSGNKWTKMKGFRCARDNREEFSYQEWWYNSIIKHDHSSMEECQRFCETDTYCGACDYWPLRPTPSKYGKVRSFFLCDLRDQAPCDDLSNEEECSYVMILDRAEKTWSQKSRSCSTMEECDYYGKTVRAMHYDWYGIFQGGMIPLTPDSEDETYNCIRQLHKSKPPDQYDTSGGYTTPSTTTFPPDKDPGPCVEWSTKEMDQITMGKENMEAEFGTCFCFQDPNFTPWLRVKANPNFCAQWSCAQTEIGIQKEAGGSSYGSNYGSNYKYYGRTSSTGYTTYRTYYNNWNSEREITNCACTVQSENKRFCMEWDCQENEDMQNTYHVSWDNFDSLETERYICKETDNEGLVNKETGRYCTKWTGNIVGRKEFELSECRVTTQDKWGHPLSWACEEHGWSFWQRPWAGVICSLISVLGTCLYFGITCLAQRNSGGSFLVFSVGFAVLTLIGTMCAGLLGFLVMSMIYLPTTLSIFIMCGPCQR